MPDDLFSATPIQTNNENDLERFRHDMDILQRNLDPRDRMRSNMQLALGMLHRYATDIVHVGEYPVGSGRVGGRLKNSCPGS